MVNSKGFIINGMAFFVATFCFIKPGSILKQSRISESKLNRFIFRFTQNDQVHESLLLMKVSAGEGLGSPQVDGQVSSE